MSLFSRSQPKNDPKKSANAETRAVKPRQTSTVAVMPKGGVGVGTTKSARLRNATDRINAIKSTAGKGNLVRPKRALPSGRVMPKAPVTPASGESAGPQRTLAEVITTERKVRTSTKKKQVGQLLLKAGKITEAQLEAALKQQDATHKPLGQVLVQMGACAKSDIAVVVKQQRTITTVNLKYIEFDPEAVAFIDRTFCEKHKVMPFEFCDGQLCIAMSNALDTTTKNEIKELTQQHIKIFDASNADIQSAIQRYYSEQKIEAKPSLQEEAKKEEMQDDADLVIELPEEKPAAPAPASAPAEQPEEELSIEEEPLPLEEEKAAPASAPAVEPAPVAEPEPQETAPQGGDMPSVAEHLEDLDISEIAVPAAFTAKIQGALTAIPVGHAYAESIVRDGFLSPEQRWLMAIRKEIRVPAIPLFYKVS